MADIYDKSKRSQIMSKISGKETKPEILVRKFLFGQGLRFRKNLDTLPGKPDIVLPKFKTAIFVHGCFWHGHNCKKGKLPETRKDFWEKKISDTKIRDRNNIKDLVNLGWNVITVWQCELKNKALMSDRLDKLIIELRTNASR